MLAVSPRPSTCSAPSSVSASRPSTTISASCVRSCTCAGRPGPLHISTVVIVSLPSVWSAPTSSVCSSPPSSCRGPSPARRKNGAWPAGTRVVRRLGGGRVLRVRPVLHLELHLGAAELLERRRALRPGGEGGAGVRLAGEVEEAVPAAGHDRPDERGGVPAQLVGVQRARRDVAEVAGLEHAALLVRPQLHRPAQHVEELVLLVVVVERDRPLGARAVERHDRHRPAGLLGAHQRAPDLAEQDMGPAAAGLDDIRDRLARQDGDGLRIGEVGTHAANCTQFS